MRHLILCQLGGILFPSVQGNTVVGIQWQNKVPYLKPIVYCYL